jgi:hypothetical protein
MHHFFLFFFSFQNFRKTRSEVHIQGKKKFKKHVPNFLIKGKIRILEGGKRIFPTDRDMVDSGPKLPTNPNCSCY